MSEEPAVGEAAFRLFVPRVVCRRLRPEPIADEPAIAVAPANVDDPASDRAASESAPAAAGAQQVEIVDPPARSHDEARCAAIVRERAIALAGEACARALHAAIARNPLFVARFVDDAMEAAGRPSCTSVRLSPADAAACDGRVPIDVVADGGVGAGEVVVASANGAIRATIDERARVLVRAVADA